MITHNINLLIIIMIIIYNYSKNQYFCFKLINYNIVFIKILAGVTFGTLVSGEHRKLKCCKLLIINALIIIKFFARSFILF